MRGDCPKGSDNDYNKPVYYEIEDNASSYTSSSYESEDSFSSHDISSSNTENSSRDEGENRVPSSNESAVDDNFEICYESDDISSLHISSSSTEGPSGDEGENIVQSSNESVVDDNFEISYETIIFPFSVFSDASVNSEELVENSQIASNKEFEGIEDDDDSNYFDDFDDEDKFLLYTIDLSSIDKVPPRYEAKDVIDTNSKQPSNSIDYSKVYYDYSKIDLPQEESILSENVSAEPASFVLSDSGNAVSEDEFLNTVNFSVTEIDHKYDISEMDSSVGNDDNISLKNAGALCKNSQSENVAVDVHLSENMNVQEHKNTDCDVALQISVPNLKRKYVNIVDDDRINKVPKYSPSLESNES